MLGLDGGVVLLYGRLKGMADACQRVIVNDARIQRLYHDFIQALAQALYGFEAAFFHQGFDYQNGFNRRQFMDRYFA